MSMNDSDLIERLHAVAEGFEMPPAPLADDVHRGRRRVRRNRGLLAGAAAATVAVVLVVTAAVAGQDRAESDRQEPVERPKVVGGAVAVWYDANGLHHGDVVEQPPGEITRGTLALVRSGALYKVGAGADVWFHPWGGEPRIVGHNSSWGPGGDPDGDTAVWFDHDELVVYDTAAGREVARAEEMNGVSGCVQDMCAEHYPAGNGFLQVSPKHVIWQQGSSSASEIYRFDVRTRMTSKVRPPTDRLFVDVHNRVEVLFDDFHVVLSVPGRAEQPYRDLLARAKVSPNGNYLLTVEESETRFGAAILDIRSGELWPLPDGYPWIAWSSGDIATVSIDVAGYPLLACDPARRTCETLPAERPFLMPTN
jgi:hypothetical protein